jgi:hypothetical protein
MVITVGLASLIVVMIVSVFLSTQIESKFDKLGIKNIIQAIDSDELSYDEKLEYIKLHYEKNPAQIPNVELLITEMKEEYDVGEQVAFTLIEYGYAEPCSSPKLSVYRIEGFSFTYQFSEHMPIIEKQIVQSCSNSSNYVPILNYYVQKDFENFLTCEERDFFILVGENMYFSPKVLTKYVCDGLVFQENETIDG